MAIRSARRAVGNALSVLTSTAVSRATTFVLYALVARHLGTFEFGQMSLALTFFFLFQVLAVAGLRILITRAVAADRTQTDMYLVNGSLVVIISSLMSSAIMFITVKLLGYPPDTTSMILMLSLGLMPLALSAIFEAVFQGWEQMRYIAYANVPVNIAKVVLAPLILAHGSGITHLIILLLASYAATAAIEWYFVLRHISRPQLRIHPGFALNMIRSSSTFLGMDLVIAFLSNMSVLMLSKMSGETDVGLYSAASQLLVPVGLIQTSIAVSVFPAMCRKFGSSLSGLTEISEYLMEILFAISLPCAVGLFFLAEPALLLLYGEQHFLLASDVLRILIWGILMTSLTSVLGGVLLAGRREATTLRIVVIDTLLNLVLGLVLIREFGLIGAAVSTILMQLVDLFMHYAPVARLLPNLPVGRFVWKPAVASGCMAAYLRMMSNHNLFLTVVSAAAIYVAILLALLVWSHGGPNQLRARYLYLRAE